jgi:hypothetical protein
MMKLYTSHFVLIQLLRTEDCIIGNAKCRSKLGYESYCIEDRGICHGVYGDAILCACGPFLTSTEAYPDYDDIFVPGFPFIGSNYPNMTIITEPEVHPELPTTAPNPTDFPETVTAAVSIWTSSATAESSMESINLSATTEKIADTTLTSQTATQNPTTTPAPITQVSTTSTIPQTTTGSTTPISTTRPTTTTVPTIKPYDGSSMFVWTEWPSMAGESDWITFYDKLVRFLGSDRFKSNRVMTRVLDPIHGSVRVTPETTHDLWSVSTNSVFYTAFLSVLPSSVKEFMIYPYIMEVPNQNNWMSSMGTSLPLEGVFKYCSEWNDLLTNVGSVVRCVGVAVDGEEKRGYINEMSSIPDYKTRYNVSRFAYATGYTQVGVIGLYEGLVDEFYFEMYDFYVYNAPSLQLVQNSDVGLNDVTSFASLLLDKVLARFLPFYESPRVNFMWSVQNSGGSDCLYPDGPTTCGIKEDFGIWSMDAFLSFVVTMKDKYATKFGNKPHGIYQFSFVPNSWYNSA